MTRDDLLNMLKIPVASGKAESLAISDEAGEIEESLAPASETALQLDDWSLRRGGDVIRESEKLRGMFEIGDFEQEHSQEEWENMRKAELATADFHAAAFEPSPTLAARCKNERIHRYMKNLMETPEFQALHSETQLDETASEIATAAFAEKYVEYIKKEEPQDEFQKDMQAMSAAAGALQEAAQEVSELRDAQDALGVGHGQGAGSNALATAQLTATFKRVRGSQMLKRICERAGRFRRYAQAQQRKKVLHGRDDMVGVVQDGDIGRLLPSELVQLDDPDLELDVMRRIIERQALCRDYRGVESKARGPICIAIDESGSMDGQRIYDAKAIALAMVHIAQMQRRWCCLVGFSSGKEGTFCILPPNNPNPDGLLDHLEHFFGGGTDLDVPLEVLPAKWAGLGCPRGRTDIFIITDAVLHIQEQMRENFLAWKAVEQVKLVTLVLGNEPGEMKSVSDRVHCVRSLGLEEEAVADIFSV